MQHLPNSQQVFNCRWPEVINWLDCSSSPPQLMKTTQVQLDFITDMCRVEGTNNLIITLIITGFNPAIKGTGFYGYDVATQERKWSAKEKNPTNLPADICFAGVTTDGNGHLFVCDVNNDCVQMFSTDGMYMGPLIKKGEQGLGCPEWIRWFEESSSLVVSHRDKEHRESNVKISLIKLNYFN